MFKLVLSLVLLLIIADECGKINMVPLTKLNRFGKRISFPIIISETSIQNFSIKVAVDKSQQKGLVNERICTVGASNYFLDGGGLH